VSARLKIIKSVRGFLAKIFHSDEKILCSWITTVCRHTASIIQQRTSTPVLATGDCSRYSHSIGRLVLDFFCYFTVITRLQTKWTLVSYYLPLSTDFLLVAIGWSSHNAFILSTSVSLWKEVRKLPRCLIGKSHVFCTDHENLQDGDFKNDQQAVVCLVLQRLPEILHFNVFWNLFFHEMKISKRYFTCTYWHTFCVHVYPSNLQGFVHLLLTLINAYAENLFYILLKAQRWMATNLPDQMRKS